MNMAPKMAFSVKNGVVPSCFFEKTLSTNGTNRTWVVVSPGISKNPDSQHSVIYQPDAPPP